MLLNKNGLTEEEFLKRYDSEKYKKPSVTVDMLIFSVTKEAKKNYRKLPDRVMKLLMIKRADHPCIGMWALPGGFVEIDESLDEAAARELKEETNIENIYMEQLYTFGDVNRDKRTRIISTSYMALLDSSSLEVKASDDAEDARWFTVGCRKIHDSMIELKDGKIEEKRYCLELVNGNEKLSAVVEVIKEVHGKAAKITRSIIESKGIAFDHAKIIEYAIERLKSKIEYTDIAFNLMPELFTLTELQQVYEIILDTKLLKANFRRKIKDMVIESDEYTRDVGHRPSKLFKFNPDWNIHLL